MPDVALSRLHCAFTSEPDGWHVRDVGASNGTFVNGVQIQSHLLVEGDRVAVGGSLLLYVRDGHLLTAPAALDDDAPPPPTARLAPENAAYLRFGSSPDQEHQPTADGLKALLAISTAINAIRDEGALERELLGLLFDAVPAAEGAIVQPGVGNELIVQGFRPLSGDSPVHVNAALVRQVIGEGTGMVCADATRPRVSPDA